LRDLYPEEMLIILQHQFWNLEVGPDAFSVELSFSASRQRLFVPFTALTTFADPSVEFALRFSPQPEAAAAPVSPFASPASAGPDSLAPAQAAAGRFAGVPPAAEAAAATDPAGGSGDRRAPGEVIRFDPSRRK
jgi:hypothetical protein